MYNLKITCIMPYRGNNNNKNANLSPREIAIFRKIAKMYTRANIYVHSNQKSDICSSMHPSLLSEDLAC